MRMKGRPSSTQASLPALLLALALTGCATQPADEPKDPPADAGAGDPPSVLGPLMQVIDANLESLTSFLLELMRHRP